MLALARARRGRRLAAARGGRARPAPRAAAPGADPHRPRSTSSRAIPLRAGLPRARRAAAQPRRRRCASSASRRACAEIGHDGDGFAFDNEAPRHRVFVPRLRARLALRRRTASTSPSSRTAATSRPELWLSDGWAWLQARGLGGAALLGARRRRLAQLHARRPARAARPTSRSAHVSYYEADAFAALGRRAAADRGRVGGRRGAAADRGQLRRERPPPSRAGRRRAPALAQLFGDVWEWTRSAYAALPRLSPRGRRARRVQRQVHVQPVRAARRLLRHARSRHIRASYRNFFPPTARWQFSGIRLARDGA